MLKPAKSGKCIGVPLAIVVFTLIIFNIHITVLLKDEVNSGAVNTQKKEPSHSAVDLEKTIYFKNFTRLFAGTKFFGMDVTNERFLGGCSVKVSADTI